MIKNGLIRSLKKIVRPLCIKKVGSVIQLGNIIGLIHRGSYTTIEREV